jgi:hypothetical protein
MGIWASRAMCRVLSDPIIARLARFPIHPAPQIGSVLSASSARFLRDLCDESFFVFFCDLCAPCG